MQDWVRRAIKVLVRNPSATLLIAQVAGILLYAFVDDAPGDSIGQLVVNLFGMLVVVLALGVVRATPAYTWLGVTIGVPAVILTIVDWATANDPTWQLVSAVVHVAFYAYTLIGLLRYMFADDVVTTDEIWAVGATFTVAVWLWAYAYVSVQLVVPGSFIAAIDPAEQRTWLELLFLSTTTMTSTGLSDIVPVKPLARSVVMIQQIAGMLYLAVAVSRIVGLTLNRGRRQS
ncbi:ion channel [Propionicimonas sp.]|uniref:ion channel n=1 Tax=Propionicimonas sp. TaxID=1955623 RepID=UPI0018500121|nr:ion channel [Propionicimonas sp.]MBU3976686.1 potassium channel family protein [Actinomycetota bacterium]MBA3019752.1 two pore domain potassium channel family protein [Propionicimonas sp.]MBU3986781.1 potassium channel family protein [Actinomycetota bacterium]MBU4006693.1 potassium channel family protein [Actinomycetota bacterium]MBU4065393.1 potassium channel family protein [Actinomycetota bacterium]